MKYAFVCVYTHTCTYEKEYLDLTYLYLSTCSLGHILYTPESRERKREGFKKKKKVGSGRERNLAQVSELRVK